MKKLTKATAQMAQATLYATEYRGTKGYVGRVDTYVTVANPVVNDTYTYVYNVNMNVGNPAADTQKDAEKAGAIQIAHSMGCTWVHFLSCDGLELGCEYVPNYYK